MALRKGDIPGKNYLPAERESAMQEILARVTAGEDLRAICQDQHLPCFRTVFYWLEDDPELEFAYRKARRGYAAAQAHKATVLADKLARFEVPKDGVRGVEVAIKHYQWLAERMDPQNWAQRVVGPPAVAIKIITNALDDEAEPQTMRIRMPAQQTKPDVTLLEAADGS